jgi:uncharacterized protein (DUF111 family)
MIRKLLNIFFFLNAKRKIKHLPYGILATKYHAIDLTPDIEKIMCRYGIRDVSAVNIVMKKHRVNSIIELIEILEHEQIKRNVIRRIELSILRVVGGSKTNPNRDAIRNTDTTPIDKEIKKRLSNVTK